MNNTNIFQEVTNSNELQNAINTEDGLILYFYNDHCAPCLSLRPKIINLQKTEFPKMNLLFINSEENPEIPAQYGIFSNPTILIFFDKKEYLRVSKYVSEHQLKGDISRLYNMVFKN
ncbi:MAG: thioredoxin family protein [Bacteroidota bacterium]|nr:thioredoxin family protein [Bacteroidota bacterium]